MRLTSKDLILALHEAGRTPAEIATAMEYEPSKVRRILELAGKTPNVWPPADIFAAIQQAGAEEITL